MKDGWKYVGLFAVALGVAAGYFALHECGHALATVAVGGKVAEIHWFWQPHVASDLFGVGQAGVVAVGLGGLAFPWWITRMVRPRRFWMWYAVWITEWIVLWSFALSLITALFPSTGLSTDMQQVLAVWPRGKTLFAIFSGSAIWFTWRSIVQAQPLGRIAAYFHISLKKAGAVF